MKHGVESLVRLAREPQLAQRDQRAASVQEPQDQLLAPDRFNGRHAHVEIPVVDRKADLTVLGAAPLHDVHGGHDLDSGCNGRPGRRG